MLQKTFQLKKKEISKKWRIVDASGKVLGRLSTQVANLGENLGGQNAGVVVALSLILGNLRVSGLVENGSG